MNKAISLNDKIPGCLHFKWKEMLWLPQWQIHCFPNEQQYENILNTARKLDYIRSYFGKPIIITSGLRPAKYNKLIGGAKYSMHLIGMAADFKVEGVTCDRVRECWVPLLADYDMRMEDLPGSSWVHMDLKTTEGARFFKP